MIIFGKGAISFLSLSLFLLDIANIFVCDFRLSPILVLS